MESNERLRGMDSDGPSDEPSTAQRRLSRLAELALEIDRPALAAEARAVEERTDEGRFHVACVGQFKRGKSTLLNALVGHPVLPTGVLPVTAVVTVLRHGPALRVRVRLDEGGWREIAPEALPDYVTEERNPENRLGVRAVEVYVPSALLAHGLCLVDTPGIGSVHAGNTEATRAFVPHIDAALVVLGADPPISGEELALIEQVARRVRHLVFALNKADRLADAELREAAEFTREVLTQRLGRIVSAPLLVSATERLASGPTRDWSALEGVLTELATRFGAGLVLEAEARGAALIAERLSRELEERHGALTRPIAESQQRVAELRRVVADAERAIIDLGALLSVEQQRLARRFEDRQAEFLRSARLAARAELDAAIAEAQERRGTPLRRRALELARQVAHHHVDPWLAEQQRFAEREYRDVMGRFVELANQFLERIAASDAALAHVARLAPEAGFRVESGYYAKDLMRLTMRSPWTWLADQVRPRASALAAIQRDAGKYLETLVEVNAARVKNDLAERVLASRRRLEAEVRDRLREVHASAERALAHAEAHHRRGEGAIASELARIEHLHRQIEALMATPRRPTDPLNRQGASP